MKALDTNVLVRFLTRDDPVQAETVYGVFKQAESQKDPLWVPVPVVLETIWVLTSVYEIPDREVVDVIKDLLQMPALKFEARAAVQGLVSSARELPTDLSDLFIGQCARQSGCQAVLTFDKKAAKSPLFELIG